MSQYIPNTCRQQKEMLQYIGAESTDDLFNDIPQELRLKKQLDIPSAGSEMELTEFFRKLSLKNRNLDEYTCFLGAGAYDHYIPSVVGHIVSRQEFYTAYTPYQPEISQGILQAIFEYQTMICELTGMDISNASMYDGATATAEAAAMACRATGKRKVVVARTVHPENRAVLKTYARFNGSGMVETGYRDGKTCVNELESHISDDTAAVIMQNPNFFGVVEDLRQPGEIAHRNGAMFIVIVDPVSLGILKPPGEFRADIVTGEGQPLGNPLNFGGPYLGFLAASKELLRRMPGRIAGETVDNSGRRGFVLTVQTREQHIRREKATSNICSNQALNALAAAVYMSTMGRCGLKETAELCLQKAHYAYKELAGTGKMVPAFSTPFFKEFALKSRIPVEKLNRRLLEKKIIGGYALGGDYPELEDGWLVAVTEKRTVKDIDRLVSEVMML